MITGSENFRRPGSGLANAERAHLLKADEFSILQNVKPRSGNLVKRGGTVEQGSAAGIGTVRWLFHAYDTAGGSLVVRFKMEGTSIYYKIGAGAWTVLLAGLTAGTYPRAVQYQDYVWFCDGVNTARKFTVANPPVASAWSGLPASFNPSLVTLHKNRLYIAGDTSTPTLVYMSGPGTPETYATTDFYQVPDNQQGYFPKELMSFGEWIGLFTQDGAVRLEGTGPLSHRFRQYPRGANLICSRTVADMGGVAYLHTDKGCAVWDGYSPMELLDPLGRMNWSDFDLTTPNLTWAMRWSDREYMIAYPRKGNSVASTVGTPFDVASFYYALRTRFTTTTGSPTQTSNYLLYDSILKQWSGPHTGNFLCGALESYHYGDTMIPWVGSSTTGGKVFKAEQNVFTDDGAEIACTIRTGALAPSTKRVTVRNVALLFGAQNPAASKCTAALYFENRVTDPPDAVWDIGLGPSGGQGEASNPYITETFRGDFVVAHLVPGYSEGSRYQGYQPVLEINETSSQPFELRSYEAEIEPANQ